MVLSETEIKRIKNTEKLYAFPYVGLTKSLTETIKKKHNIDCNIYFEHNKKQQKQQKQKTRNRNRKQESLNPHHWSQIP